MITLRIEVSMGSLEKFEKVHTKSKLSMVRTVSF